ncbi:MAG: hypothetical protein CM1200mP29_05710 [Verrucomicrobiota bacterium]|nr:MAG: hypothetical protein CM1200mP29_05710 [Verrucomicrobiota bacterium]
MKYTILSMMRALELNFGPDCPLCREASAGLEVAELTREKPVDFTREILPILRKNCLPVIIPGTPKAN